MSAVAVGPVFTAVLLGMAVSDLATTPSRTWQVRSVRCSCQPATAAAVRLASYIAASARQ